MIGCETETLDCPAHGPYAGSTLVFGSGKRIKSKCPTCNAQELRRAEAQREAARQAQRQRAVETLLQVAAIPPRFAQRNFENFRATTPEQKRALQVCRHYAEHFTERLRFGGGLVLAGKPGTGKTHLAAAIIQSVIAQGRSAAIITAMKCIRRVKETYAKGSITTEREALRLMLKPELLILDEVGMQIGSDTERMVLSEIINDRYCELRPTILITNLTARELAKFVGERTMSRMEEGGGVILAFDWESYRAQAAKDPALTWPEPAPVDYAAVVKTWTAP